MWISGGGLGSCERLAVSPLVRAEADETAKQALAISATSAVLVDVTFTATGEATGEQ